MCVIGPEHIAMLYPILSMFLQLITWERPHPSSSFFARITVIPEEIVTAVVDANRSGVRLQ